MHFWRQNLKKEDHSRGIVHQRGAVWFGHDEQPNPASVHWEVCVPGKFGIGLRLDYDDEPLHLFLGFFGLFTVFLSINAKWARNLLERADPNRENGKPSYQGREWELRFHADVIRWNIGCSPDGWSTADGWRNSSFYFLDWLFGRHKYKSEELQRGMEVAFVFPEGVYTGTVTLTRDTWKRKRWPRTKVVYRANIEVPKPPMFAGKGENSYDCEDDAIYGMTCQAKSLHEAITAYEAAVYRNRARYGMPDRIGAK